MLDGGVLEPPTMTRFLTAVRQYMQTNHGLSFEGLMQRFNITLTHYIEASKFEEMCLRLNLTFTALELKELVASLDVDHMGKVKTAVLR